MIRNIVKIMISVSLLFIFSCGKSGSDSIPKDGFSMQEEGALLKKAPEEKSESISIVPFGTKINITDKATSGGNATWYKIK